MRRSTIIALVVGAFGGLGIQLAHAQLVDPNNPKVRNLTVTNSESVGNDLTVGDDLTVTDQTKTTGLDAGYANIAGQFCANNGQLCATASGVSVGNDFTVTTGNDGVFSRDLRVNDDFTLGGVRTDTNTDPTVTACSGGTAASVTWANGSAAFVFDVGTACVGESTAVITLPAAASGWICSCSSTTADRMLEQKTFSAAGAGGTTITMQNIVISTGANGDFIDGADVGCMCRGGG